MAMWASPIHLDEADRIRFDDSLDRLFKEIEWLENGMGVEEGPQYRRDRRENAAVVYTQILLQALEYNGDCLHVCHDAREAGILRLQCYMPVGQGIRQCEWIAESHGCTPPPACEDNVLHTDMGARYQRLSRHLAMLRDLDIIDADEEQSNGYRAAYTNFYRGAPQPRSSPNWIWVEFAPVVSDSVHWFFEWLRSVAGIDKNTRGATLDVRLGDSRYEPSLVFAGPEDARIYFTDARPMIRPKTPEQHAEVDRARWAK